MRSFKKNRSLWFTSTGIAAILTLPTPGHAIFGIGDIVFDPTNYASLVSQLTTMQTQFTMLKKNLTHFDSKQLWETARLQLENTKVRSLRGETGGMTTALGTDNPSSSTEAWSNATVPQDPATLSYLASLPETSPELSQLAMVETSDSISPDCMTAIGAYRAQGNANAGAQNDLQNLQLDSGDGSNSEVQQLNLLNASDAQRMTEAKAQGTLQTCIASQMMLANMAQRNEAMDALNFAANVQTAKTTLPANAGNESDTWDTYVP